MEDFESARERVTNRKKAIAGDSWNNGERGVIVDNPLPLFVGYDLDPPEVLEHFISVSATAILAIAEGDARIYQALMGMLLHGFMLGMELNEVRREA